MKNPVSQGILGTRFAETEPIQVRYPPINFGELPKEPSFHSPAKTVVQKIKQGPS